MHDNSTLKVTGWLNTVPTSGSQGMPMPQPHTQPRFLPGASATSSCPHTWPSHPLRKPVPVQIKKACGVAFWGHRVTARSSYSLFARWWQGREGVEQPGLSARQKSRSKAQSPSRQGHILWDPFCKMRPTSLVGREGRPESGSPAFLAGCPPPGNRILIQLPLTMA